MGAIDQLRAHFSAQDVRTIEVPEWGLDGNPLLIYAKPLTLSEKQRLRRHAAEDGDMAVLVYTLIFKALDAEGKPLFTVADKKALMDHTDPDVIARVVMQITRPRTDDELRKN